MRASVLALLLLVGCKHMGSFGSGLGHVASGIGHVASAAGHVASAVGHVAAPVAAGIGRAAAPVASGLAKAAPVMANATLAAGQVAQTVLEAAAVGPVYTADDPQEPYEPEPTTDLCLDCPDVGNCNSCPDRHPQLAPDPDEQQ